MAHTYEELKNLTVAQLRDIAKDIQHEALQGYSTMHKDHLLPALCKALGIEGHAKHVAHGVTKTKIKKHIHSLKAKRDAAMAAHDAKQLARIRVEIHGLKRELHRMTV